MLHSETTSSTSADIDAAQKRRLVETMLQQGGIYAPPLNKLETKQPSTYREVHEQLQSINDRFRSDFERLTSYEAALHHEMQEMIYLSYDGIPIGEEDYRNELNWLSEPTQKVPAQKVAESKTHFPTNGQLPASTAANIIRAAHACNIAPLKRLELSLRGQHEEQRVRAEKFFPDTIVAFRRMDPVLRARIAKYLVADERERERILEKRGWAWRQTEKLVKEHRANNEFKAEVQKVVQEARTLDEGRRESTTASDPRKRKRD